ncbi:reverse transcriptase domain-containing protein [Tanacetum coccineum]
MKKLTAELPMLTAPMEKEELIVYLAATKEAVSAVLMTEKEAKHMPIYFVSGALRGPKLNYKSMEKLVLALVHAIAERLQKWSIELGEYTIHYRPRVSIKGQILADFIVERPEEDSPDTLMVKEGELPEPWILFDVTNNKAEYEALIAGLRIAEQTGMKNLQANVDSRLVANQVNETYVAKEVGMIRYLEKIGGKKQEMDRRTSLCSMGTPHNDKIQQRRQPVLINVRDRGSHPSRNLQAYTQNSESGSGTRTMKLLEINLDLLEEMREEAAIREAKSKAKMEKYYNAKVQNTGFKPGDLVYHNNDASRVEDIGKLGPKWEGPYEITEALGKGAYKLRDRDGKQLPRTWNISNLKKCYVHTM